LRCVRYAATIEVALMKSKVKEEGGDGMRGGSICMRCKMKGIDKSVLYQVILHLDLPTHHPSLKFIFLGGIQGETRGFRYSSPYSAERISSGAI
jgi:hypothetical protein